MTDKINTKYVVVISASTLVLGFILGFVIATIVLLRFQSLYQKLQNFCKRTTPETAIVHDKRRSDMLTMSYSAYSEIDDRHTATLPRNVELGQDNEVTKHSNLEECSSDKQNYTNLKKVLKDPRNNYEQIEINDDQTKLHKGLAVSCPVYNIIEPGTEKRLAVKPLVTDTIKTDGSHVYFKLEPGSDKVLPVPVSDVKDELLTSHNRKSEPHPYFVLEAKENPLKPEEINPCMTQDDRNDPKYYILEKST